MAVLGKDGEGLPLEFNRENVRSENRKGTDRNHQNLGHMEISPRKNENSNQSSQFASWPQFPPAPVLLGVQISGHFPLFRSALWSACPGTDPPEMLQKNLEKKKDIVIWLVVQPLRKLMVSWDDYSQYMEK